MIKIANLSLENEMDLVLAHKKTMRVAEKLGLTLATQTTFATAVSEIARTVIEHTDTGYLDLGLEQYKQRYSLKAAVTFDSDIQFTNADEGFYYAQKLVPEFSLTKTNGTNLIEMILGLPRSLKLDYLKIEALKKHFKENAPLNAYEEIKLRNLTLKNIAEDQEEELKRSKIIDAQKTEFISVASHEFKTPITVLKAYTQIARSLASPTELRLKEILEKIDLQSTKLTTLVQQMLDVSKMENSVLQYQIVPVSLNGFMESAVSAIGLIIPDHKLTLQLEADVTVLIDSIRIEQVLSNILVNAAKYSSKNSKIDVYSIVRDDVVEITIADEGIGLSEQSMRSVFEKFYRDETVKDTHPGLGMGLYITSKIVNDHGGTVSVESTEGVGSKFTFSVPRQL